MSNIVHCTQKVEKWGIFEIALEGKCGGNPFTDYEIKAEFSCENEKKTVDGFYDGNGIYKVRFMPSFEETYRCRVSGTYAEVSENGRGEASNKFCPRE